jgi:hypothetical protein
MQLVRRSCHFWKHLWNCCCGIIFSAVVTFFGYLQYPEIFVPLGQNLFLEKARRHSSQIRWIWWVLHFGNQFLGQKLLARKRLLSWGIVMVENPIVGSKFRYLCFSYRRKWWSLSSCLMLKYETSLNILSHWIRATFTWLLPRKPWTVLHVLPAFFSNFIQN